MKQENVKKLLSLTANYVEHVITEENDATALEEIQIFIYNLNNLCEPLSDEEKSKMISETIAALNDGSEEAEKAAFLIRIRVLLSGDDELIATIEYLHEVI